MLVEQAPEARVKIVRQLVRLMDKMKVPCARASVVWMLGAYHHLLPKGPTHLLLTCYLLLLVTCYLWLLVTCYLLVFPKGPSYIN